VFPAFAIACGEEASDPLVLHDGRVVRVDELAASGHLERQDDELAAVAALGVRVWRCSPAAVSRAGLTTGRSGIARSTRQRVGLDPSSIGHFGLPYTC
jgi:hypothetical protein